MTPGEQRLARIAALTPGQMRSALEFLSGYVPEGFDQAVDIMTTPVAEVPISLWPVYLQPVPEFFCADCKAPESQVPLVEYDGIYLCSESRQCLARRAAKTSAHDPVTCRNGDHYGQCSGATPFPAATP